MAGSGTAHLRGPDMLLRVENLVVEFGHGRRRVHAVSDVSLDVAAGETLGLVGESGCGKSTTGRAIAMVHAPTSGSVRLDGTDLTTLDHGDLRRIRTKVQLIFQDPISSLNPRRKIRDVVAEPLSIWGMGTRAERQQKVAADARGRRHRPRCGRRAAFGRVLGRPVPACEHRPRSDARAKVARL